MGERRGTRGLELWCRRMTEGYPGVQINNMTTSWRDGLAFCAIIHHFRPELIDFSKLNKNDVYKNNLLAFQVAERHLGIPALLEPDDMVKFPVPDRLSILTYLSQFYQTFVVAQGSPSRTVPKRPSNAGSASVSTAPISPPPKMPKPVGLGRREPCAKCGLPVFIAERLNVSNQLYHRTCFCCARCNAQLTLTNYYETEIENQFCCETCPDEELNLQNMNRSLSDELKSASLKKIEDKDDYSDLFESALEEPNDNMLTKCYTLDSEHSSKFIQARSQFITSQLKDSELDDDIPDLPKSSVLSASEPPDLLKFVNKSDDMSMVDHSKDSTASPSIISSLDSIVNSVELSDSEKNQPETATNSLDISTKENIIDSKEGMVETQMLLCESISDEHSVVDKSKDQVPSIVVSDDFTMDSDNTREEDKCDNIESKGLILESSIVSISDTDDSSVANGHKDEIVISISSDSSLKSDPENVSSCKQESINIDKNNMILDEENPNEQSENNTNAYPEDLNPFGDEDLPTESNENTSLNPFDDETDDEDFYVEQPKPTARKKISLRGMTKMSESGLLYTRRISVNPFEPIIGPRKVIQAPKISLDFGYWNNSSINEDTLPKEYPVPAPRKERTTFGTPDPKPRKLGLQHNSAFGSNSSLSSTHSSAESRRYKKTQAPRPPTINLNAQDSGHSSLASTPCTSAQHSPKSLPRSRKLKKAPPPPTSTPFSITEPNRISVSPIYFDEFKTEKTMEHSDTETEKVIKDEQNRNRQSECAADTSKLYNKSTHGKWKRGKGPAPTRPIPKRRSVKTLPLESLKHELEVIEIQLQGLEKQGVRVENLIRDKCEGPDSDIDAPLAPEVEGLILDLFELVNEKNGLFRRQAELMCLRRQQRLEEEYADLEYQIRCLLIVPELNKTDSDKAREEELMKRLYEVVEQRNEIVECLEMDRVREAEEDDGITKQINLYTLKNTKPVPEELAVKKKTKKFKLKGKKVDIDKDIDESETSLKKEKKKKKFNIF